MARILIGTASWTDKSLIASKAFYPRGVSSAEDRLRYYASQFPMVEIDSSYYAMPSRQNAQLWAERTPPEFTFNIKAFRLFTGHQTSPAVLPPDISKSIGPTSKKNLYYKDLPVELREELWWRFRDAIEPLRDAGKLTAVHFQFAPWMALHPENREHIEECQDQLEGYQLSVEFRNRTWFDTEKHRAFTLRWERERRLVNTIVDEPQIGSNSIPAVWEVTVSSLSVLRLHGRNHATWNIKGNSSADRFNYDYNDDELEELADNIGNIPADLVQVVFNNNYGDQGQRNARTLRGIIGS